MQLFDGTPEEYTQYCKETCDVFSRSIDSIIHEKDIIPDKQDANGFSCGLYHAYHVNGDNIFPLLFSGHEVERARVRAEENPEDVLPFSAPQENDYGWWAFCLGFLVCGVIGFII